MRMRCLCWCHKEHDGYWRSDGVDVFDVLEAAIACTLCINHHCPALLGKKPRPTPAPLAEKDEWKDPPPSNPWH